MVVQCKREKKRNPLGSFLFSSRRDANWRWRRRRIKSRKKNKKFQHFQQNFFSSSWNSSSFSSLFNRRRQNIARPFPGQSITRVHSLPHAACVQSDRRGGERGRNLNFSSATVLNEKLFIFSSPFRLPQYPVREFHSWNVILWPKAKQSEAKRRRPSPISISTRRKDWGLNLLSHLIFLSRPCQILLARYNAVKAMRVPFFFMIILKSWASADSTK